MHKRLILATLSLALLAACNREAPAPQPQGTASDGAPQTALGRQVDSAMRAARQKLQTENITLGENVSFIGKGAADPATDPLPKGEITQAGDLLIDGKPVPVDAAQRALLLEYRGHALAIAEAGMALGVRGADLGMQAAGEAIRGIFSGDTQQVEQRIQKRAAGIEAEATKLCGRLPAMRDTQDRLAAALPAFKPYARLDQSDVDNCNVASREGREQRQQQIRESIQGGVRDAVRGAAQAATGGDAGNAAEQAEADSAAR